MRQCNCVVAAMASLLLAAPSPAGFITDGNLGDWGVTVGDNNTSHFNFAAPGILAWQVEDQDDRAGDGGYLGPYSGGQKYDAEAMAVAYQGGRWYLMMVTGQRPSNGLQRFSPGDLRIETTHGVYGLEIGGGAGGGAGTAIVSGAPGTTYTLNSNGYTTAATNADPQQLAGSIWGNANWLMDAVAHNEPVQFSITNASNMLGLADYVYSRDSQTLQHSIIELSFPQAWFGGDQLTALHWRPGCNNDQLDLAFATPEPITLILLTGGGLLLVRRRR